MYDVKAMCERLAKFYWSPERPETYVIEHQGKPAGLGKVACRDYAAFNLVWLTHADRLDSYQGQWDAVQAHSKLSQHTDFRIGEDTTLENLLLGEQDSAVLWLAQNYTQLPDDLSRLIGELFSVRSKAS